MLENKTTSVADMSAVYQELVSSLQQWSADALPLLNGSGRPFNGAVVKLDATFDSLAVSDSSDALVLKVLQLLMPSFSHSLKSHVG